MAGHEEMNGGLITLGPGVRVAADAVRVDFVASSGPGGQNVNKRATKAHLRVAVDALGLDADARERLIRLAGSKVTVAGELIITAEETRSQKRNERAAYRRLWELIVRAKTRPRKRRATRVPRWAIEKRLREKKRRGDVKRRRKGEE